MFGDGLNRPVLFVFGDTLSSPIERLLIRIGSQLEFDTAEHNPLGACGDPDLASRTLDIESVEVPDNSYVVLVTRGVNDVRLLKHISRFNPTYVAVVASNLRWYATKKQLLDEGVSKKFIEKIRAPAGIDIGAVSLEEIAISILAEIIRVRRTAERGEEELRAVSQDARL